MFGRDDKESARDYLRDLGIPMDSHSYWWVKYPIRAINEIQKLVDNTNASIYFPDGEMICEEIIWTNFGTPYRIRIVVHDSHPFVMPCVTIVEPVITNAVHRWNDGKLCLMHPDEYDSRMSILEFRNMTATWCFCHDVYQQTSEWPAAEYIHT